MRIVVTGGSGRVGQVTTQGLQHAGHEVVIVDTAAPLESADHAATCVEASATDYGALLNACRGSDAIIHLAGIPQPTGYSPHFIHNTNVTASYNVLCAAAELKVERVLMASSVNAIGLTWSRCPEYDYFPVDERHPTRNEDPYSLSKWIGEQQADSIVRLYPTMTVASLRLHMFMPDRAEAYRFSTGEWAESASKGLWGYTTHKMWIDACLGALTAEYVGHEVFFIVAQGAVLDEDPTQLARSYYPDVPLNEPMIRNRGFFDCSKAEAILRWAGKESPNA